ncbi:18841_t:CDS:2 [Racocetra fulgida]|uniref:18841_t:CDS:1 n=1 Tax=Racocetra fulgida TaxID=60492 RepID=A0A9N8WP67_9GLOM|nr:18841_t:CDS:2 [Racocetra fulgida]
MGQLVYISELNGCYDPLAYLILFLCGEQSWALRKILYKGFLSTPEINNVSENSTENIDVEEKTVEVSENEHSHCETSDDDDKDDTVN